MARMSASAIEKLKKDEGLHLTAYKDGHGFSVGYGHFGVNEGTTITQKEADDLLAKDLAYFEKRVENLLARDVSQKQFDALVSYAYNAGINALRVSKTLEHINEGRHEEAVKEWVRGWDKELPGVQRRRREEAALYAEDIKGG
jgi:lysozyme